MHVRDLSDFEKLSTPEKILLVKNLWDRITSDESNVPVPESHKAELKRRHGKMKKSPGKLLTLDELKSKIDARK